MWMEKIACILSNFMRLKKIKLTHGIFTRARHNK